MKRSPASRALRALTAVIVGAVLVLPFVAGFSRPGAPLDEGLLLAYPEFLKWGARPGVDFVHPYGPGNLWLLRWLYDLFGASIVTERAAGLVFRLAILVGVFAVSLPRGRVLAVGSAALAALVLAPLGIAATTWFAAIATLIWALFLLGAPSGDSPRMLRCAADGALVGVTLVLRTDLMLVAAASIAPLVLAMRRGPRFACATGVAVAIVPLLLHVGDISLGEAYRSMVVEPAVRAPAHVLPIPPRQFEKAWYFLIAAAAALILLAAAIRRMRRGGDAGARMDLALALLAITLMPQMLQRADPTHITYAACISIPLLPRALVGTFDARWPKALPQALAPTSVAIALMIGAPTLIAVRVAKLALAGAGLPTIARGIPVEHAGRYFLIDDARAAESLGEILGELGERARAGDRLFVGPRDPARPNYNDTFVYFLVPELRPASYYSAVIPGITIPPNEIGQADFLILTTTYDWRGPAVAPNPEQLAVARILRERFCPAARHGDYELLERC